MTDLTADPEVIDIRSDERLDTTRLEPYLREHLPSAHGPMEVAQFGGGHANLTYLVKFDDAEYVLRRPPLGPVAPSAHDMGREHRVLSRLAKAFDLAPDSYVFCEDEEVIGAPFHVMERRHGFVIRDRLPAECEGNPELNRRIGEMIVDSLAKLHRVDTVEAGLGDLGHPEGFVARQLEGWAGRWEKARDKDIAQVDAMVQWLGNDIPEAERVSLLHNDYKLDNMLVAHDDPARCVAILDWDMCTRGDPLMDLGYLLNFWVQPGDDPRLTAAAGMPTNNPGFMDRDGVIARYAAQSGFDVDRVLWYHVFGVFKLLVIVQQIYIRWLRGQTKDARFEVFGERVQALAEKGAALMEAA